MRTVRSNKLLFPAPNEKKTSPPGYAATERSAKVYKQWRKLGLLVFLAFTWPLQLAGVSFILDKFITRDVTPYWFRVNTGLTMLFGGWVFYKVATLFIDLVWSDGE